MNLEHLGASKKRPKQAKIDQNRLGVSRGSSFTTETLARSSRNVTERPWLSLELHAEQEFTRKADVGVLQISNTFTGNRKETRGRNFVGAAGTGILYRLENTPKTAQRVLQYCTARVAVLILRQW